MPLHPYFFPSWNFVKFMKEFEWVTGKATALKRTKLYTHLYMRFSTYKSDGHDGKITYDVVQWVRRFVLQKKRR